MQWVTAYNDPFSALAINSILGFFILGIFLTFDVCSYTILELVACVLIALRFAMEIAGVFEYEDDTGPAAAVSCILIDGASLILLGLNGGIASVVIITLDRYWKIVHPIHHRKHYSRRILYVGLFLPWLNGVAVHLLPAIGTTRIVNGVCNPLSSWPSEVLDKVCSFRVNRLSSCAVRIPS